MLVNLLIVMEERGYLKLVRNVKGEVTGGLGYPAGQETGPQFFGVEREQLPSAVQREHRPHARTEAVGIMRCLSLWRSLTGFL